MFKCYSQSCNNEVSEEYTTCESCGDKLYKNGRRYFSINSCIQKARELSKSAPNTINIPMDNLSPFIKQLKLINETLLD